MYSLFCGPLLVELGACEILCILTFSSPALELVFWVSNCTQEISGLKGHLDSIVISFQLLSLTNRMVIPNVTLFVLVLSSRIKNFPLSLRTISLLFFFGGTYTWVLVMLGHWLQGIGWPLPLLGQ